MARMNKAIIAVFMIGSLGLVVAALVLLRIWAGLGGIPFLACAGLVISVGGNTYVFLDARRFWISRKETG